MATLVDVGMPVFNGSRYLRDSIISILEQDYADFRLIISDNASTDGSEEIIAEFSKHDSRIEAHFSKQNAGGAWNFNRVFRLGSAQYFKWAAADDICEPTFLSACISALETDKRRAVLAHPTTGLLDQHGELIRIDQNHKSLRLDGHDAHRRAASFIRWHGYCHPLFGVIRRDALDQTRLHAPWTGSDIVLLCELLLKGPFYELSDVLFYRRIHPEQAMIKNQEAINRRLWFDPSFSGKRDFPHVRLTREYLSSVSRYERDWGRAFRGMCLLGGAAIRRHGRSIVRELLRAGK